MPNILERDVLREPFFSITINGEKITEDMLKYVSSVRYEDEQGKAGIAYIVVEDKDGLWMEDARIIKDAKITLTMGHRKNYRLMLSGKIKNVEANFPETGIPTFVIVAVDTGTKLTGKRKTRSWKNKKLSDVIVSIFKENGLAIEIVDTKTVLSHIAQSNETDLDFVKRKAKELKWFFYKTSSGVYYFGPTDKYGESNEFLDYRMGGMQIKSFSPSFQEEVEDDDTINSDIDIETGKTKSSGNTNKGQSSSSSTNERVVSVDKVTGEVKVQPRR